MSCGTAQGSIVCECGSWSWPQRRQCVINRMRRLHAQAIAGAPDNDTRKTIINAFPEGERPEIRRIAIEIIRSAQASTTSEA